MSEPTWIEKIYTDDTGEDFLGLRAVQGSITNYLLPGIITITPRARYYSFYAWLLHEYSDKHPKGMSLADFVKRREQIFALANLSFDNEDGFGDLTAGLIGKIKLNSHFKENLGKKEIPLSVDDYIGADKGGYGQYVGVMRSLGIIRESENPDFDMDLLTKSEKLAAAFQKSIQETKYYKKRHEFDVAESINQNMLYEYGEKCYLSGLAKAPDANVILEILFGFDAQYILPDPRSDTPIYGNMIGSLGLILDMLNQAREPFDESTFREWIMYGACSDYASYSPTGNIVPFLDHWRMYQIREYYVYSLYEIWDFFLDVMRTNGPFALDAFLNYLEEQVDPSHAAKFLKLKIPSRKLSKIRLNDIIDSLFEQSGIKAVNFDSACKVYANKYEVKANEKLIYDKISDGTIEAREDKFMAVFYVLTSIYIRLRGIQQTDKHNAWIWAKEGGVERRAMSLFVQQMEDYRLENKSLLQVLELFIRDYLVSQHTITALRKWWQRGVNTFHFSYENGVFEWIKMDQNAFTAPRFVQAYAMIRDLGLVNFNDFGVPNLTKIGKKTLERIQSKLGGQKDVH